MVEPAGVLELIAALDAEAAALQHAIHQRGLLLDALKTGADPFPDLRARHEAGSRHLARLVQRIRRLRAHHRPH